MATFYLIRHADTDAVGKTLVGRTRNVHLNTDGIAQSERLVARLASVRFCRLFSSPLERARETMAPLAAHLGLEVELLPGVNEVDFGDWTGCSFEQLRERKLWQRYNAFRSGTRPPGGEQIAEVQLRALLALQDINEQVGDVPVAVVSHGDVIRSILAHCAATPLDLFLRLEVSTASVSAIRLTRHGPRVLCMNMTEAVPA